MILTLIISKTKNSESPIFLYVVSNFVGYIFSHLCKNIEKLILSEFLY